MTETSGPKIAIVGAGAVGGYYGGKLARVFSQVSFLLRSDYQVVKQKGLRVQSPEGDFCIESPNVYQETQEIGEVDLVIVALKATSNDALAKLLPPLIAPHTVILTLQNGIGSDELLQELFPNQCIVGGLCFVCINRLEGGVIQHLAHGKVEMGSLLDTSRQKAKLVCSWFQSAGIDCSVLDDLSLARWRKLVWNVPFNGIAISEGGIDVSQILADSRLLFQTKALMREVQAAAAGHGHVIKDDFLETNIEWTRSMGAYRPSSLIDFLNKSPIEVEAIWGEPLRRAQAAGVSTPILNNLYRDICKKVTW